MNIKKLRPDYNSDINFIEGSKCIKNLFTVFEVDNTLKAVLIELFNDIVKVESHRNLEIIHDEMNNLLENFWNTREIIKCDHKINQRIASNLIKCIPYLSCNDNRNAVISIIRIPEFFYISHEELSEIQKDPENHLDKVPMLSNEKSIFKIPNKDIDLCSIVENNQEYIASHCGEYDENIPKEFIDYLFGDKFKNKDVAYFMKMMRFNMQNIYEEVIDTKRVLFCSKTSSHFFPGTKSLIEDNFWEYSSKVVSQDLIDKLLPYPKLSMSGDYDYLNLAFGLGPDYKVRNIVFTNALLQNIGSIVRFSAKKTFDDQEKISYCPIRTDSQLNKFHRILEIGQLEGYKICFDLSKYSDYLLSQMIDLIIDYISPTSLYANSLKKIQKLPIKINNLKIPILFGTGAGVKSNFDLITIANMLMIDFCSYYYDIPYENLNVVGDDLFLTSAKNDFHNNLITIYTHFNCKVNQKKAKVVKEVGRISFCGRHFWVDNNEIISWNGLSPGLWMKEIYSMNRLNAIYRLMKETWQNIDQDKIIKLFKLNEIYIDREFRINKMGSKPAEMLQKMMKIPYDINGLKDENIFTYEENIEWVEDAYGLLDNYMFAMKNNYKVKEMFSKYYDLFPKHPIIDSFLYDNGKYLKIIQAINQSYDNFKLLRDERNYVNFKYWIKKAITEFGKLDPGSSRISTKDRTSDYFNEDLFWKPTKETVREQVYRFSSMELEVMEENEFETLVAETYMRLKNRHIIRNGCSVLWDSYSGVYIDLKGGKVGRLFTLDSRQRNGKYENWNLCYAEIYDKIYPEFSDRNDVNKLKVIEDLANFVYKLKKKGVKRAEDIMYFFES